jgi:hypothetical protein
MWSRTSGPRCGHRVKAAGAALLGRVVDETATRAAAGAALAGASPLTKNDSKLPIFETSGAPGRAYRGRQRIKTSQVRRASTRFCGQIRKLHLLDPSRPLRNIPYGLSLNFRL